MRTYNIKLTEAIYNNLVLHNYTNTEYSIDSILKDVIFEISQVIDNSIQKFQDAYKINVLTPSNTIEEYVVFRFVQNNPTGYFYSYYKTYVLAYVNLNTQEKGQTVLNKLIILGINGKEENFPFNPIQIKNQKSLYDKLRDFNIILDLFSGYSNRTVFEKLNAAAQKGQITYTDIDNLLLTPVYAKQGYVKLWPLDADVERTRATKYVFNEPTTSLYNINTSLTFYTSPDLNEQNYISGNTILLKRYYSEVQGKRFYSYDFSSIYTFLNHSNPTFFQQIAFSNKFGLFYYLYDTNNNLVYANNTINLDSIILQTNNSFAINITEVDSFSELSNSVFYELKTFILSLYDGLVKAFNKSQPYTAMADSINIPYSDLPKVKTFYDSRYLDLDFVLNTSALYYNPTNQYNTQIGNSMYGIYTHTKYKTVNSTSYLFLSAGYIILPTSQDNIDSIDVFDIYQNLFFKVGDIETIQFYSYPTTNDANDLVLDDLLVSITQSKFLASNSVIINPLIFEKVQIFPYNLDSTTAAVKPQNTGEYEYQTTILENKFLDNTTTVPTNTVLFKFNVSNIKIEKEIIDNAVIQPTFRPLKLYGIAYNINNLPSSAENLIYQYASNLTLGVYPYDRDLKNIINELEKYQSEPFPLPIIVGKSLVKIPKLSNISLSTIKRHFNQTEFENRLLDSTYTSAYDLEWAVNECINILQTYAPDQTNDINFLKNYLYFTQEFLIKKSVSNVVLLQKLTDANNIINEIFPTAVVNKSTSVILVQDNKNNIISDIYQSPAILRADASYKQNTKINSPLNPVSYTFWSTVSYTVRPSKSNYKIPLKKVIISNQNNQTGDFINFKFKGYVYDQNTQTSYQHEITFTKSDLESNYYNSQYNTVGIYLSDLLPQNHFFYNSIEIDVEYYKPYTTYEFYDYIYFTVVPFFEEYQKTATIINRIVWEPVNLEYVNITNKFTKNTILPQRIYSIPLKTYIFNIYDDIQSYLADNKKCIIFNNYVDSTGDALTYTDLTSLLPSDLTSVSNDFYILDFKNLNINYTTSSQTRYLKPVLIDDYKNKQTRGQVKIDFLDPSSATLFNYFTQVNTFNIDYTDTTSGSILFLEGKIADYTTGMQYEELLKLYKIVVNLETVSSIIEDINVPFKFSYIYRIYNDYNEYLKDTTGDATSFLEFTLDQIDIINIKSTGSYLEEDTDYIPKILQYIEYEEIYGDDPLKRKDYIYTLSLTLRSLDTNVLQIAAVYMDLVKLTDDVQFAVPNDFFSLNTTIDIEDKISNLTDIEQTQDKEKILDFVNHYISIKGNENLNASALTFNFKIKLIPKYYGLNYASIVINSYPYNSANSQVIPYVFYKEAANVATVLYKKSNISYKRLPVQSFFKNIAEKYVAIPITDLNTMLQYYRLPEKATVDVFLFNSSSIQRTIEFRYVQNTSGKNKILPDVITVNLNPLESKIITIEEPIESQDFNQNKSGFIEYEIFDTFSNVIIDTVQLPIPSLDEFYYQQFNLINRVGFYTSEYAVVAKSIEDEEDDINREVFNPLAEKSRVKKIKINQVNIESKEVLQTLTESAKLYYNKKVIVSIPDDVLDDVINIVGSTNHLASGYVIIPGLGFKLDENLWFTIKTVDFEHTKMTASELYKVYETYKNIVNEPLLDYTTFLNTLFTDIIEVIPVNNENGVPYVIFYYTRTDLLKWEFQGNSPQLITIKSYTHPLLQDIYKSIHYFIYKDVNEAKTLNYNQKDILEFKVDLVAPYLSYKEVIAAVFCNSKNSDFIQKVYTYLLNKNPSTALSIDQSSYIKEEFEKPEMYVIPFERSGVFKQDAYPDPIHLKGIVTAKINPNIAKVSFTAATPSKKAPDKDILMKKVVQDVVSQVEPTLERYLKYKEVYERNLLWDIYYEFQTLNIPTQADAYISIQTSQGINIPSNAVINYPIFNIRFNGVNLSKSLSIGSYFLVKNGLFPSPNKNTLSFKTSSFSPIYVFKINEFYHMIQNGEYFVYNFVDKPYFRRAAVSINIKDAKLQRGSLFASENEYYAIQVIQDTEFKIIGEIEGEVNTFGESYITINSIELYANTPFNIKVLFQTSDGESQIGDYNTVISIGKTYSKYKFKPNRKFSILLSAAPDSIGAYKCLLKITYTFLGEIKEKIVEFGIDVQLPKALQNEYIVMKHERMDSAIEINPNNYETLSDAFERYSIFKNNAEKIFHQAALKGGGGFHYKDEFQDGSEEEEIL